MKIRKPRSNVHESVHVNVDEVVEEKIMEHFDSRIYSLEWIRFLRSLSSVINLEIVDTPSRDVEY